MNNDITILYVEDEKGIRDELSVLLKYLSTKLYLAGDGEEGLEAFKKYCPDIVISDIKMPKMSGLDMSKEIKKINPKQYILFTTAHSESSFFMEAIDLQVDGFILKPVDLQKLEKKLLDIAHQINLQKQLERQKNITAEIVEMSTTALHNVGNAVNSLTENSYQLGEDGKDLQKIAGIVADAAVESKKGSAICETKCLGNNTSLTNLFQIIDRLPSALNQLYDEHLLINLKKLDAGVNHISDIVRIQQNMVKDGINNSVHVETFDLQEAINDAVALISDSLDKSNIKTEFNIQVGDVALPRNPFIQMVNNLIKNAKEAIDEHNGTESGLIIVSASVKPQGNGDFNLEVVDNGSGISSDKLPQIFNFGYTNKEHGSGFGLHSVASFVQSLGGEVSVTSDGIDKGSTFHVSLPLNME